ncbi:curli production assembly/transport component CsgG [Bacteriovorax sp. BSW11_IV]|uniref:curli production assembly/transport component CsgG n=1 Tax=Bacteriovorax sp. BSW11_IV TaxID=1353529 RepID=UPI00038A3A29|nr:curli production assembly/transport component CsgG [Bacteriovorax sp. BSW11_IV]EQC50393.1 curli production assembly/transport component CsgG [Bacteriovorax sp. BSW11_IV]
MLKIRSLFKLLIIAALMCSCATDVVNRTQHGQRPLAQPKKFFNGVKKRVALLSFFNESPFGGEDLGVTATSELLRELSRTGEFVVDPMGNKIFGSSKEIYAGGGTKLVQLSRKAKMQGVNFVVFGRIIDARVREKTDEIGIVRETKAYSEAKVEIRIFDVNSNKEVFTETLNGQADDSSFRFFATDRESKLVYRRDLLRYSVRVATRRAIPRIMEIAAKLDWVGRVAKITGGRIYINAGRASGINIGDILKVVTEGEEMYDPETGALIGVTKGQIKGTIEVVDFVGEDGSATVLHSGGSVLEGDFVQLY